MIGLIFYSLTTFGFALYFPARSSSGFNFSGLNFIVGYALTTISLYVLAVVAKLDNQISVFVTCIFAIGGALAWRRRCNLGVESLFDQVNPVFFLLLAGMGSIILNGGIGYTPTTDDEFTNWIGVSRLIHFSGNFDVIKGNLNHAAYLPGWRLILLAPWQVKGYVAMGESAAAPFVLHVGFLAFFYNLVTFWIRKYWNLDRVDQIFLGLGIIFLFAAAEGLGRLWPFYLLIEPPQIMTFAAIVLTLLAFEEIQSDKERITRLLGIILAASIALKTAALMWIPSLIIAFVIGQIATRRTLSKDQLFKSLYQIIWVCGPGAAIFIIWKIYGPSEASCTGSFATLAIGGMKLLFSDWTADGFLWRFLEVIGGYILTYKTILTLASIMGILYGVYARVAVTAVVGLSAFTFGYFLFLYLANLSCWIGGVEELTSYQRYTRVIVQTFHALGLALLVRAGFDFWLKFGSSSFYSGQSKYLIPIYFGSTICLVVWQLTQIHASVGDLETREKWGTDPRIADMKNAVSYVNARVGSALPNKPKLLIMDQGYDYTSAKYALFFATTKGSNGPEVNIEIPQQVSWSPIPRGAGYVHSSRRDVKALFESSDIIWIRNSDEWVKGILEDLQAPSNCNGVLLKERDTRKFVCKVKDQSP